MAKQETATPKAGAENTANQGQTPAPTSGANTTLTPEQLQTEAEQKAKDDEAKALAEAEDQKEQAKSEVKAVVKDAVKEALSEVGANTPTAPTATSLSASPAKEVRNPDMVYAKRGESEKTQFSKREWDLLGADKGGWIEDVEVPAEVKALEAK